MTGVYDVLVRAVEQNSGLESELTFTVTVTSDCRCNVVTLTTDVQDFVYTMKFVPEIVQKTSVFAETITGQGCTTYTYTVDPDAQVTVSTAGKPSIVASVSASVPDQADLDGDTTTVTITATSSGSGSTVSDTFVITWKHECWDSVITVTDFADVLITTTRLGVPDSFDFAEFTNSVDVANTGY